MPVPEIIKELVGKFDSNRDLYCGPGYNETRLRREFLDPFFEALGWDVDNTGGVSPVYQEVVHEYGTDVEGSQKTADYAFRIGERVKFFVEAKKPGVRLKEDAGPAYQLRKYAYSKQLPLSILTDFEEFAVYDGQVKPADKDTAAKARVMYLTYEDYVERWDDIEAVFGREAIWKGAFDKFADENKGGKHEPLDKTFLAMLERWRDLLARNVANRNRDLGLDRYALTWAVQAILDRIIFLQVAEARGIEPDRRLQSAAEGPGVYERLVGMFREADDRYNSGLFHFREEKDRPGRRDELTPGLSLDDAVLRKIINELYDSPYEFGVVPVEILGHAYEQFLGKTIYVDGRGVHIDDKPEVRKAGGVYYTPQYIVEYIVENTVGKLLAKSKTPKDVVKLRILDPACGSGSFLLGAYQRLLDWHLEWYFNDGPEKHADVLIPVGGEERRGWRLYIAEKKRILLNNIYGVDIDASAVEVTKLSLLLKALEGESAESVGAQEKLYKDRALPDLANNIKCGNSLIGRDYFDGQLTPDLEEVRRVNPFDWDRQFPEIMSGGGFNAVIGNPPYVRQETLKETKKYLAEKYEVFDSVADTYCYFIEKSLRILRENGLYGMIISNKWMRSTYGAKTREFLVSYYNIKKIVDFGLGVFEGATTRPAIILIEKTGKPTRVFEYAKMPQPKPLDMEVQIGLLAREIDATIFDICEPWALIDKNSQKLLGKIRNAGTRLSDYISPSKVNFGIKTGLNKAFIIDGKTKDEILKAEPQAVKLIWPVARGEDIRRYQTRYEYKYIIVTKIGTEIDDYPVVFEHLKKYEAELRKRGDKGDHWWELRPCSYYNEVEGNKIIFPDIAMESRFTLETEGIYVTNTAYFTPTEDRYLLGVLASSILWFVIRNSAAKLESKTGKSHYRLFKQTIDELPIRTIDFSDAADTAKHDAMVAMVDRMLDLHKRLAAAKAPNKREALQREIDATDARIDALVYELYGLTDVEIKIVEGSD